MTYATIGSSWICESFISAAKTVEGITLNAVYSRSSSTAADFAKKHGAPKYYTEFELMARDSEIDAVYIASPNVLHYEQSLLFLQNNKSVICEKPATSTLDEMLELYGIAEKNGLIYTEAIMSIHTPAFKKLITAINEIGKIRSAHFDFCQLSSKYPAYLAGKNPNIFNPEMHTGCLMDIGVYNIYLAAALFGMPEQILSAADFLESGADSNGGAILKYSDKTINLSYSKTGQSYSPSEIIGDCGSISMESISQLTGIYLTNSKEKRLIVPPDISRDSVMSGEADFFLRMNKNRSYSDEEYLFAKNTALTVRKISDEIRKQCCFPF